MRNHSNLNRISKFLLILVAFVIVTYNVIDYIIINTNEYEYNYVELKTRFKRYIIVDKYTSNDNYMFRLVSPTTKKEYKTRVTENLYYNMYFVGDTIK